MTIETDKEKEKASYYLLRHGLIYSFITLYAFLCESKHKKNKIHMAVLKSEIVFGNFVQSFIDFLFSHISILKKKNH